MNGDFSGTMPSWGPAEKVSFTATLKGWYATSGQGNRVVKRVYCFILALCFAMSTLQPFLVLAQEDGAALLEERCSGCHPSSLSKSKQKTPKQWQATVSRMKHKGARLTEDEMKILVDYLSETYKP